MNALRTLIFLKEKRSGEVKSQTCINRSPQREWIPKEDAAAPTASTDTIFITDAIDTFEARDVAFTNMPRAFLMSAIDEKVIVLVITNDFSLAYYMTVSQMPCVDIEYDIHMLLNLT